MSEIRGLQDVKEKAINRLKNSELGKLAASTDVKPDKKDAPIVKEVKSAIQNKLDGLQRERDVAADLNKKYSPEKGYSIIPEAYLRDKNGNIMKDPITGEARRIDFIIEKNEKVVDSIEVTSKTADKTTQCAKEARIRAAGGNYIRDSRGKLVEIPTAISTRIERRD